MAHAETGKPYGDHVKYYPALTRVAGGVTAALMLSRALHWIRYTDNPDGWFYKTQADWETETGLTRWEQEGARKALRASGVWEERRMGDKGKLHFRVDHDRLLVLLNAVLAETTYSENRSPVCGKTAVLYVEKPQSLSKDAPKTAPKTAPKGGEARKPTATATPTPTPTEEAPREPDYQTQVDRATAYYLPLKNQIYRLTGSVIERRKERELWHAKTWLHFEAGVEITAELIQEAGQRALKDWRTACERSSRPFTNTCPLGWLYTALDALVQERLVAVRRPEVPVDTRTPAERAQALFGLTPGQWASLPYHSRQFYLDQTPAGVA